ncbi:hypothetical protein G6F22_020677 [Rhizopus arrhizus]|nr:hypothetical protein G6F22_020677 [Rhizopus arrhizus]
MAVAGRHSRRHRLLQALQVILAVIVQHAQLALGIGALGAEPAQQARGFVRAFLGQVDQHVQGQLARHRCPLTRNWRATG